MESVKVNEPKNEVVNKDNSTTNIEDDANIQDAVSNKQQDGKNQTTLSDNDSPGQVADEGTSNKGQGPSGENL